MTRLTNVLSFQFCTKPESYNWFEGGDNGNGGCREIVSTALENPKTIYEVRLQRGMVFGKGCTWQEGVFF